MHQYIFRKSVQFAPTPIGFAAVLTARDSSLNVSDMLKTGSRREGRPDRLANNSSH